MHKKEEMIVVKSLYQNTIFIATLPNLVLFEEDNPKCLLILPSNQTLISVIENDFLSGMNKQIDLNISKTKQKYIVHFNPLSIYLTIVTEKNTRDIITIVKLVPTVSYKSYTSILKQLLISEKQISCSFGSLQHTEMWKDWQLLFFGIRNPIVIDSSLQLKTSMTCLEMYNHMKLQKNTTTTFYTDLFVSICLFILVIHSINIFIVG